jgi:hypothetical protein
MYHRQLLMIVALPFIKAEEVESEVRRIATKDTTNLILLDHAHIRCVERGINLKQITNVLKNGDRTTDYTWDTHIENGWKCTFQRVTAGIKVTVAVKLVKRESVSCLVVTVF